MTHPDRYQPTDAVARQSITSQATVVEQSRAVAEVQAAVTVAQQRPRNRAAAVQEMRDATAQMSVASRAYFRFRRGGENVTGPSIHLARELARSWGNIDYGIKELRRDDAKGESEMLAHAWDMQTNARASTTFIVPHIRDTRDGAKKLTETRDIYENNANAGARRLREMILAVLPSWYVEEAKSNCDATLEGGGGKPIAQRVADAIRVFEEIGVSVSQLEAKLGSSSNAWTGHDVGQLGVIYSSIKRGETTIGDEFTPAAGDPETGVSAAEITSTGRKKRTTRRAPANEPKPEEAPAEQPDSAPSGDVAPPDDGPANDSQLKRLGELLGEVGLTDDAGNETAGGAQ
ncbi:hypothetical protein [Nocardia sp. No.11]|uniref:hypothetical protein n=1 Tax=Nocardia sp. No.11 TaxID=3128861 RepID=UPI00319DA23F